MFTSLTTFLLALALLTTVPLAVRAIGIDEATGHRHITRITSAARCAAAASLVLPRGTAAGALAGLWLAAGAAMVWRYRRATLAQLTVLAWLPAAAAWLVADRLGVRPVGFSTHLVTLTAAHFHHAGLGVSALLATVDSGRGLVIHQFGMVTVAAGLTATHATGLPFDAAALPGARMLEPAGAVCIVVALMRWSRHAWRIRSRSAGWRRRALTVSALAWTYPMLLALGWALAPLGPAAVTRPLTRPLTRTLTAMVAQHGAVNAIAVVLLGLASLSCPGSRKRTDGHRFGMHIRTTRDGMQPPASLDQQGVH